MEAKRLYKWVILLLVLINGTLLYLYWSQSPAQEHRPPHKRKSITIMLQMTGNDKQQVLALEKEHFKRKEWLIKRGVQLHQELFQSFDNPEKDSTDVAGIIDKIVENQREMEQMTFDHFRSVSKYCDAEQKRKLKKGIYFAIQQMSMHLPGKRPHRP